MGSKFVSIFYFVYLIFLSLAHGSRPGGGPEGPDVCMVEGQVVQINKKLNLAQVALKEIAGSSTDFGCSVTGVDKMIGQKVPVSMNVTPALNIHLNDIVFLEKKKTQEFAFLSVGTQTIETISSSAQTQWDMKIQQQEIFYYIRAFLDPTKSTARLKELLFSSKTDYAASEQRLSAAVLLLAMATYGQFDVPEDVLFKAFMIALGKSYKGPEIAEQILMLKQNQNKLVDELGEMLGKKQNYEFVVSDPYGILVALKRLGPMAKRVLPTVLNRMDRVYEMQRAKGDDFLLGYFEKINAPSEIATLFLKGIDAGELKTKDGVLAKAICRLKPENLKDITFLRLKSWCQKNLKN